MSTQHKPYSYAFIGHGPSCPRCSGYYLSDVNPKDLLKELAEAKAEIDRLKEEIQLQIWDDAGEDI